MIVVRLRGGLGNQMFQYAAGRRLAESNHDHLVLDLTRLLDHATSADVARDYDLDIFEDIHANVTGLSKVVLRARAVAAPCRAMSRILTRSKAILGIQARVVESGLRFDPRVLQWKGSVYLDGYWQSAKYFSGIEAILRNEFSFRQALDPRVAELAASIARTNSVCLNVRRGDFVSHPESSRVHGFVGAEYYAAGVDRISQHVERPHFFIFSDDMDWARANLAPAAPHTFVGHEFGGHKFRDYLRLMSMCRHFLIPNSTFAWWAAWLSSNGDKTVVAPKRWFVDPALDASDIYLPSWVRL